MRIGLDTSVVLRLLTGEPEAQALCALEAFEDAIGRGATLLVSDLVVSEVYFALQFHYGVAKAEAVAVLARFFRESGVRPLGSAAAVLAGRDLPTAKPGFVDRLIHAEYRRAAGEVLTFERAAGRLAGVRVLAAR